MNKNILVVLVTIFFLLAGFALIEIDFVGYGIATFIIYPFTLGFALSSTYRKIGLYWLLTAFVIFLFLLIIGGAEGIVCVLMASPLVLGIAGLGVLIEYLINKKPKERSNRETLLSICWPFLVLAIFGVGEEHFFGSEKEVIAIESVINLPYTPMQVYNAIKSVDTLDTEKPFLMKLDLPVPQKCILEEEKVGGQRICYFEGGLIVEEITALEKGKLLKMDVVEYQLTGRKWLGFEEAIYTFDELEDGGCKMSRITTYTSKLYPRFYWGPLERIGIEQEHEYVFSNLQKDLSNNQ